MIIFEIVYLFFVSNFFIQFTKKNLFNILKLLNILYNIEISYILHTIQMLIPRPQEHVQNANNCHVRRPKIKYATLKPQLVSLTATRCTNALIKFLFDC